jgi:ferredoxin-NADP reductase
MTLDSAEEYLLISIGSGFAPMLSIMEDLFLKGSKTKVYNVF